MVCGTGANRVREQMFGVSIVDVQSLEMVVCASGILYVRLKARDVLENTIRNTQVQIV